MIYNKLRDKIYNTIGEGISETDRRINELYWARIWDDTCRDIEWIRNLGGISPGRWAVGYNYIYVMTRILNELRSKNILDLGLGISTSLIAAYVANVETEVPITHTVVEQDEEWRRIYTSAHNLPEATDIQICKMVIDKYKGHDTYMYDNFKSVVEGKKYDLISVDGPYGGERYSRVDIVPHIPDILAESFVIILDDTERTGEYNTACEIKKILNDKEIAYKSESYRGLSECTVIVSEDNKHICTL